MYVLSITTPPQNGAAFGKSTVLDPVGSATALHRRIVHILTTHGADALVALSFAPLVTEAPYGSNVQDHTTGLIFRIDTERCAPNACPCCGRLVNWQDHALAGSDDAYCEGCFTWGNGDMPACSPNATAHHNPWTTVSTGARWCMVVVFEPREGETDSDYRFSAEREEPDADTDTALIAWPELTAKQIITVAITSTRETSA